MGGLSIIFKVKFGVSHSPPLRNTTSSLDRSFRIFFPVRCTEHTISHGHRVALMPFVTPRPNEPPVTTHGICRLTPQTNTSLSHALWPHSCAPGKTSQEITHPKIDPHQARLTVEFLANVLSWKKKMHLVDISLSILFKVKFGVSHYCSNPTYRWLSK